MSSKGKYVRIERDDVTYAFEWDEDTRELMLVITKATEAATRQHIPLTFDLAEKHYLYLLLTAACENEV